MSAFLCPTFGVGFQAFDNAGRVLAGGKLYTYQAGSTAPQATWTDSTQAVQNANPLVLNSAGRFASEIWLQGGSSYKFVLTDSGNNQIATWDYVSGMNDANYLGFSEWVPFTTAPSYVSANSFTVNGNQVNVFQVGRRVQAFMLSKTLYGTVNTVAYNSGAGTTLVTMSLDTGSYDATLYAVSYGFMSAVNTSLPVASTSAVLPLNLQNQTYTTAACTGSTGTYAMSLAPSFTLATASRVNATMPETRTGACTLNVNSSGAIAVKQFNSLGVKTDPTFYAGQITDFIYDGTNWIVIDSVTTVAGFTSGTIDGVTIGGITPYSGAFTALTASNFTLTGGTANQLQFLNASKMLSGSASLTWDGTYLSAGSVKDAALTAGRVTYAGTSGLLQDSANLTFDGTTLTAAGLAGPHNGTVGATTPAAGAFTTLSASSTVSGAGFSAYLASPPAIGGTAANAGAFTTLSASSTVSGTGFSTYLASPPAIGGTAANTGKFSALTNTALTAGRVVYTTTGGLETDSVNLTFNGTTLTAAGLAGPFNGTVGATTANTGAFTDLSSSGTLTLSAGVANSVGYLNASKQFVTSSALTFDGTNLGVSGLTTSGTLKTTYTGGNLSLDTTAAAYARIGGSTSMGWNAGTQHIWETGGIGSPTEQMRLTSTGLVIGASSPLLSSSGRGNVTINGSASSILAFGIGGTNSSYVYSASDRLEIDAASTRWMQFNTNGNERMRLDASGNLGLGVTPSAWSTGKAFQPNSIDSALWGAGPSTYLLRGTYYNAGYKYTSTDIPARSMALDDGGFSWLLAPSGTAGTAISFTQAMTLDASGNLIVGGTSAVYGTSGRGVITINGSSQALLGFTVGGADKGFLYHQGTDMTLSNTAVGAVILQTSNTERARIDSSGNLLVGTTTNAATNGIIHAQSATNSTAVGAYAKGTTSSAVGYYCKVDSSSALYAYWNCNGVNTGSISTTGTTTLYNITSDQRLKENIQDADSASALIDSLQVRKFDWKADGNHQRYGFVAQELVTVAPEAVHQPSDSKEMMAVDYSKLVPMLVKELQSLRARVAQLEKGN